MRALFLFIVISLNLVKFGYASGIQSDSIFIKNGIATISKELIKIDSAIARQSAISKLKNTDSANKANSCSDKSLSYSQKLLVIMPSVLFILFVLITLRGMKSVGFNFKQALYNDEPEDIVKASPTSTDPNATIKTTLTDKNGNPVYYPSTSRIIVFLTGLTTLIVIVCFITYYAYCMMKCLDLPPFEDLFKVIMGLGLGIVPYGVNRIADATKKSNP